MKAPSGTARARIVAAELLDEFDLAAADDLVAAFDLCLAGEAVSALRRPLERRGGR